MPSRISVGCDVWAVNDSLCRIRRRGGHHHPFGNAAVGSVVKVGLIRRIMITMLLLLTVLGAFQLHSSWWPHCMGGYDTVSSPFLEAFFEERALLLFPRVQFAAAQPNLITNRPVELFSICGDFAKSAAGTQCTTRDPLSWLATPAASHRSQIITATATCGRTKCYWLDGRKENGAWRWSIGGSVESSLWLSDQPNNSPVEVLWAGCYYGTDGLGNDVSTKQSNAMCMRYLCSAAMDCNSHGTPSGVYDVNQAATTCPCRCDTGWVGLRCNRQPTKTLLLTTRTVTQTLHIITLTGQLTLTRNVPKTSTISATVSLTRTLLVSSSKTSLMTGSATGSLTRTGLQTRTRTRAATDTVTLSASASVSNLVTGTRTPHATETVGLTPTASGELTTSKSLSFSLSVTRSGSHSGTSSVSHSNTASLTESTSLSLSFSLPSTQSSTLSGSTSTSESFSMSATESSSATVTQSATASGSPSPLTASTTLTEYTGKPTQTMTHTCVYDSSSANQTCLTLEIITDESTLAYLLRGEVPPDPLPDNSSSTNSSSSTTNSSSSPSGDLNGDGYIDCNDVRMTTVTIPFEVWGGRSDSFYTIAVRPNRGNGHPYNTFDPLMDMPTRITGDGVEGSGFALVEAVFFVPTVIPAELVNGTLPGVNNSSSSSSEVNAQISDSDAEAARRADAIFKWKVSHSHEYVLLRLAYTGRTTLNEAAPFYISLNPQQTFRCPLPGQLTFKMVAGAASKPSLIPDGFNDFVNIITGVLMLPSAAVMLGMLMSVQSMSRCEGADLDEEPDFMSNPIGLVLGADGEAGRYQRGIVVGAAGVYAIFSGILMFMSIFQWVLKKCVERQENGGRRRRKKKRKNKGKSRDGQGNTDELGLGWELLYVLLIGFPSALLPCSAFILDGVSNAGITLLVFSPFVYDNIVGAVVLIGIVVYIIHVGYVTHRTPQVPTYVTLAEPCGGGGAADDDDGDGDPLLTATATTSHDPLHDYLLPIGYGDTTAMTADGLIIGRGGGGGGEDAASTTNSNNTKLLYKAPAANNKNSRQNRAALLHSFEECVEMGALSGGSGNANSGGGLLVVPSTAFAPRSSSFSDGAGGGDFYIPTEQQQQQQRRHSSSGSIDSILGIAVAAKPPNTRQQQQNVTFSFEDVEHATGLLENLSFVMQNNNTINNTNGNVTTTTLGIANRSQKRGSNTGSIVTNCSFTIATVTPPALLLPPSPDQHTSSFSPAAGVASYSPTSGVDAVRMASLGLGAGMLGAPSVDDPDVGGYNEGRGGASTSLLYHEGDSSRNGHDDHGDATAATSSSRDGFVMRFGKYYFTAQCEWEGDAAWDNRYHHYIADVMPSMRTYRAFELVCGNVIAALEALAFESQPFCVAKVGMSLLVLLAMLLIILFIRPMAVRSSVWFMSITISLQLIACCIILVNVFLQRIDLELASGIVTAAATIFVLITSLVETAWFVIENAAVAKLALSQLWAMRNRKKNLVFENFSSSSSEEEEEEMIEPVMRTPSPPTPVPAIKEEEEEAPQPAEESLEAAELRAIRQVLSDYRAHYDPLGLEDGGRNGDPRRDTSYFTRQRKRNASSMMVGGNNGKSASLLRQQQSTTVSALTSPTRGDLRAKGVKSPTTATATAAALHHHGRRKSFYRPFDSDLGLMMSGSAGGFGGGGGGVDDAQKGEEGVKMSERFPHFDESRGDDADDAEASEFLQMLRGDLDGDDGGEREDGGGDDDHPSSSQHLLVPSRSAIHYYRKLHSADASADDDDDGAGGSRRHPQGERNANCGDDYDDDDDDGDLARFQQESAAYFGAAVNGGGATGGEVGAQYDNDDDNTTMRETDASVLRRYNAAAVSPSGGGPRGVINSRSAAGGVAEGRGADHAASRSAQDQIAKLLDAVAYAANEEDGGDGGGDEHHQPQLSAAATYHDFSRRMRSRSQYLGGANTDADGRRRAASTATTATTATTVTPSNRSMASTAANGSMLADSPFAHFDHGPAASSPSPSTFYVGGEVEEAGGGGAVSGRVGVGVGMGGDGGVDETLRAFQRYLKEEKRAEKKRNQLS